MDVKFIKTLLASKTIICFLLIIIVLSVLHISFNSNFTRIVLHQYIKGAENFGGSYLDDKYKNFVVKDKYKIVFITEPGGEASYAENFKYAATEIGWEVKIYSPNIFGSEEDILHFDPDMILTTEHVECPFSNPKIASHRSKKYFASMGVLLELYFDGKVLQVKKNKLVVRNNLGAILDKVHGVISPSKKSLKLYESIFSDLGKKFFGIQLLATVPKSKNVAPTNPQSLIWLGRWDSSADAVKKNKKFIEILSKQIPMKVYGSYNQFGYLPKGVYDGFIPPGIENLEAIHKNGIYLLTHATLHFTDNTPSSLRLFEAAAAKAVIISDLHPFVLENFGDSVLYFDQNAKPELRAKQVTDHVDWILKNPEKAKELAKKSNQIFLKNFSLDKGYLIRLAKMHEAVLDYEKQLGLSYNLVY